VASAMVDGQAFWIYPQCTGTRPKGQLLTPPSPTHLAHDHRARVDAYADGQVHALLPCQTGVQRLHAREDIQAGTHRPLGVIFVRLRIAEVDEQAIAEILRDSPLITGDHFGAYLLMG